MTHTQILERLRKVQESLEGWMEDYGAIPECEDAASDVLDILGSVDSVKRDIEIACRREGVPFV